MAVTDTLIPGEAFEPWVIASISAVQAVMTDQLKDVRVAFTSPSKGWLEMLVYVDGNFKLKLLVVAPVEPGNSDFTNVRCLRRAS